MPTRSTGAVLRRYIEKNSSINFIKLFLIQESRTHTTTEQSSIKFTELFRTKYETFMEKSQSSVFCPEKFRKFYLNSSIKFIELVFSV